MNNKWTDMETMILNIGNVITRPIFKTSKIETAKVLQKMGLKRSINAITKKLK